MAGEASKEELVNILVHAMLAAKNIRPQRNRLLQLRRRLQQKLSPGDVFAMVGLRELALDIEHINLAVAARLNELAVKQMDFAVTIKNMGLAPGIFKVYFVGIAAGARDIAACLELAAESGARLALDPGFAAMPEERLYDALVAQQLLARPTTLAESFSRVEAAFYAVKLSREHLLPRCIEYLTGIRPPPVIAEPSNEDDPVDAAATEHLANTDLSDPAPAAAAATGEPPQAAARISVDHDKARTFLDRACTLANLAVKHIDLAVKHISSFLDPKEVASLSDYTDRVAYTTALRTDLIHQMPGMV